MSAITAPHAGEKPETLAQMLVRVGTSGSVLQGLLQGAPTQRTFEVVKRSIKLDGKVVSKLMRVGEEVFPKLPRELPADIRSLVGGYYDLAQERGGETYYRFEGDEFMIVQRVDHQTAVCMIYDVSPERVAAAEKAASRQFAEHRNKMFPYADCRSYDGWNGE